MKKILLTVAAACMGTAMFAQQLTAEEQAKWISVKKNLIPAGFTCNNMLIDFSNDHFNPTTNGGNGWWAEPKIFTLSYDATEKAVLVDVDLTDKSTAAEDNWTAFNFTWTVQINDSDAAGGTTARFNPFAGVDKAVLGDDTLAAEFVDISNKLAQTATVTYKLVGADSANLRMDLGDGDGKGSNRRTPHWEINSKTAGWLTQTFNWNATWNANNDSRHYDADRLEDGYVGGWLNINNGRYATVQDGLPSVPTTGDTDDAYPLDKETICKVEFGVNDAKKYADAFTALKLKLYIQSIQIGNGLETQWDLVKCKTIPGYNPVTSSEVVSTVAKVYPTVGNQFNIEGAGELKDINGNVVAKGVNVIDAAGVAPGMYIITVGAASAKVIVE